MQSVQKIDIDDCETPQAQPRLLVVDDVADNRAILMRRLVRRGFEVVEAIGGQDALDKIAADPRRVLVGRVRLSAATKLWFAARAGMRRFES